VRAALLLFGLATGLPAQSVKPSDNPHGQLSITCSTCHLAEAWKPIRVASTFRHAPDAFPLEGAHASTTCAGCHERLDFKGVSSRCASCHEDVHKGELGSDCGRCHTPRTFAEDPAMKRAHELTRFPLRGAHAAASCAACHSADGSGRMQFVNRGTNCATCHGDEARAVSSPNHDAAGFTGECTACHSIATWKNPRFDHAQTGFPLVGAHQVATCDGCHADGVYDGKPTTCVSCHRGEYDQTTAPRHADGFPTTCADCHGNIEWKGAQFDHQATRFPLTGGHAATTCQGCHSDGTYRGKTMDCAACHAGQYSATTNPPHQAAGFATTCANCHNTAAWLGTPFDHGSTRFTLTGAHQAVACSGCHGDQVFRGKSMECLSCHQADFNSTANPPHGAAGFTAPCTSCHTTTRWTGAVFDHSSTDFALTGAHVPLACARCHADGVYNGKPTQCVSCHRADYDGTTVPPHAAAGYATTCATCHGTSAWLGSGFTHTTKFPLTGVHQTTSCLGCHADGVYAGKPATCVSCHQADFDGARTPTHAGFPLSCESCHATTGWQGATFDHGQTDFPLTGAHLASACSACHADGVYNGKPTDCYSCHRTSYEGTTTPPHGASGIGTTCTTCHTTNAWSGATYDHSVTAFPLTGAHRAAGCEACHADRVYRGKPSDCASCHLTNYQATTNPPHAAAGYPTTCANCHNTTAWLGAPFDHSVTNFPLTGAHLAASCQLCHGDGVYKGKPTDCASCHQSDYTATTKPPHGASGIGTTCTSCHTTAAWVPGTYDHTATAFPLTGAHTAASCAACHADGVYRGKSTECVSCHQSDYTQTTNPNHAAAFFPTTCASCHTTSTWNGATFNHDAQYFPIYSGKHRGKWTSCATCHTSPANFQVFTCLTCHEHEQTKMDDKHKGRAGYSYTSTACLACHPNGDD
jgi:hypothetical protein